MRLIDADKLLDDMKKELEKAVNEENMDKAECMVIMTAAIALKDFVNRQPTAYDVDKVISNIWDRSELIHIKHTHNDEIEDYIRTTDASEIVKAGGIDES